MIQIDSAGMAKGLLLAVYAECEILTEWLWSQIGMKAPPEVRRDMIHQEVIIMGNTVIGTVSAGGMQALITEWGSGSLADTSNPAWDEYTRSGYWNPARDPDRHTIRGRPAGEYTNLDNESRHSSGGREGLDIERKYPPIPAEHWMRGIVDRSRLYIMESLVQVAVTFPFHMYIHSDGR